MDFNGRTANNLHAPALRHVSHEESLRGAKDRLIRQAHKNGPALPWTKTYDLQRLRPGEVTIWAGWPGHGKTALTNYVILHLLLQGVEVELLSLEMPAESVKAQMLRQLAGSDNPTERWMDAGSEWLEQRGLKILAGDEQVSPGQLVTAIEDYLMGDINRHVFVDNLSWVSFDEGGDMQRQVKEVMGEIVRTAQRYRGHVHLVAHLRKGEESKRPNQLDVSGSRHYVGIAHNVHLVWRNKAKEAALALPPEVVAGMTDRDLARHEALLRSADATLLIDKNRVGGSNGPVALWFHRESQQFLPSADAKPWTFNISERNP